MSTKRVSVIIPTYNEEGVVGACLESLSKQTYKQSLAGFAGKDLEIIVVDDGSELPVTSHWSPVTVLRQKHQGPGTARNLGAKEAKGEILVFVDADMTFDPDFIQKLIEPILSGKTKGTFSKDEYVSNWENVWARCWSINEGWEPKRRHPKGYPDKQKVFRAILKSEFERVGGFDVTRGYNDDWSLSEKLGYKADVVPNAVFYHKNPDNLIEIFEQAKWVAKRRYKLGIFGIAYNLLVYSFPDSLWVGFWKSLFKKEPLFIVFKIVYDLGVFIGILEYFLFGKVSK